MMSKQYRRTTYLFFFVTLLWACTSTTVTEEDYRRAESFLPNNVSEKVFNLSANPNWLDDNAHFWYRTNTRQGKEFFLVNMNEQTKSAAFDHQKVAEALSQTADENYEAYDLPFNFFRYVDGTDKISIDLSGQTHTIDLSDYSIDTVEQDRTNSPGSTSPDGQWYAYVKDSNIYIKNNQNNREFRLSKGGEKGYEFGISYSWGALVNEAKEEDPAWNVNISWSPDSKKVFANKVDTRNAGRLHLLQSVPDSGFRAIPYSYERGLPGETDVTKYQPYVFDIARRKQNIIQEGPYDVLANWSNWRWIKNGSKLYYVLRARGFNKTSILEADASTGRVRTVFEESSDTYIEPGNYFRYLEDSDEFLWASERDGWNHLYLYDWKTGKVKTQVTKGDFVVKSVIEVDEENKKIYFLAGGREADRDPYFDHFYHINFDGTGLTLLTPEASDHSVWLSPDKKYFVNNYSRVNQAPITILRNAETGEKVMDLETADIENLLATGWTFPEPFTVKARDGVTDIYGVIYRPSNFSSSKSYPVIDGTYSGPQAVRTPKNFFGGYRNSDQPLAELGFIVVTVDGLGTAQRSKAFHHFSYKNLGDIGSLDHIKAIKELASKYSYMDTERVGIYGHSAGGYDAARALFKHPDFYKVAVSSAGNHDHRVAKAWWPEQYMGFPEGPEYDDQSNIKIAHQLEGKLLLVHGDMDNNVHPSETIRLADALMKANKDFDLLIIPNRAHGLSDHSYFVRKRWDYFVEHLMGVAPPKEYAIQE